MELRHLRYFVALADTLSFTRAAEALYVSQSTLSQQIASLEEEIGCKLFERNRRRVSLTPQGTALVERARDLLSRVDALPELTRQCAVPVPTRNIRIGLDMRVLGSDFLRGAITDRLAGLREEYPELHASFFAAEYDATLHALDNGSTDLAFFLHQEPSIVRRGTTTSEIESRLLYEDELAVAVRTPEALSDTPEGLRHILTHRGVTLLEGEGRGMLQAMSIFRDVGVEPQIHFTSDRNTMFMELNSGERAAILPKGLLPYNASPEVKSLSLRTDSARLYVLAAWRKNGANHLVEQVVSAVQEAMAPLMDIRAAQLSEDARRFELSE
jgi:DNA-binding transcriptional LysR family regulator